MRPGVTAVPEPGKRRCHHRCCPMMNNLPCRFLSISSHVFTSPSLGTRADIPQVIPRMSPLSIHLVHSTSQHFQGCNGTHSECQLCSISKCHGTVTETGHNSLNPPENRRSRTFSHGVNLPVRLSPAAHLSCLKSGVRTEVTGLLY